MAIKFGAHKRGSKTRQEKLATMASDKAAANRAAMTAKKKAAPAKKATASTTKTTAPTTSSKPKARKAASTGGPARYKSSKASSGGPARYKSSTTTAKSSGPSSRGGKRGKATTAKKEDPPTQGKRMRDAFKTWWNSKRKANPRRAIGARNDKK